LTTVIVFPFVLALLGTETYSFCWLEFQAISVPSRPSTVRFNPVELIVKVRLADAPPPGAGFCTATLAVPTELRSEVGIAAVNEVADM
jgi:hypothetical protein